RAVADDVRYHCLDRVFGPRRRLAPRRSLLRRARIAAQRADGRPSLRTTRLRAARRGPPPDRARRRPPARERTGARARGHPGGRCAAHLPARRRIGDTRHRSRVPNRARRAGVPPLNAGRSLRRGTAVRPPRANVWEIRPLDWRLSSEAEVRLPALVSPPVALALDVFARSLAEVGRADDDDLEAPRPGLVASPRTGRDAHRVPLLELDDLVVELHPPAPAQDHVHLLLLPVRMAVRKAIAGRNALIAQAGSLEAERRGRQAELKVRRAVEPRSDVLQVLLEVPERERHVRHPMVHCLGCRSVWVRVLARVP